MLQISNGLLTAQVYPPGDKQLYQGTRFDHAGVVFHVTYKGQDFNSYWFDRFVVDPSADRGQISARHAAFLLRHERPGGRILPRLGLTKPAWAGVS